MRFCMARKLTDLLQNTQAHPHSGRAFRFETRRGRRREATRVLERGKLPAGGGKKALNSSTPSRVRIPSLPSQAIRGFKMEMEMVASRIDSDP